MKPENRPYSRCRRGPTKSPPTPPRTKDLPCNTGPLSMGSASELSCTFDEMLGKVAAGQISPTHAQQVFNWIEMRRKLIETQDLVQRVGALEQSSSPTSLESDRT